MEIIKKVKENKGKTIAGTGVTGIIIVLIINFGTISKELRIWFGIAPANPDRTEWRKDWQKPKSDLPDYVSYDLRTLHKIIAEASK